MPVTALVTPGPEVTSATPTLPDQDVLDLLLLEELVVDEEHGAPRVAEHVLDPLLLQAAHDDLSASQFHGPIRLAKRKRVTLPVGCALVKQNVPLNSKIER
jgi:hypothetical protein